MPLTMTENSSRYCLYCAKTVSSDKLTDEHIWPKKLGGGRLEQNVWRTKDVCGSCNSMSGIYVDGAFMKGVLNAYDTSTGILSIREGTPVSKELCYLGTWSDEIIPNSHVAEVWMNDAVWAIHIREKETRGDWSKYVGGNPITRKQFPDKQSVIVFNKSPDLSLFEDSLTTIKQLFKRVEIFAPTVINAAEIEGLNELNEGSPHKLVKSVSDKFLHKLDAQEQLKFPMVIDVDYGARFLCKLALGVGHNIIGEKFLLSKSASKLRAYFREGDSKKRAKIGLRGVGYISSQNDVMGEILKTPSKWTFAVLLQDEALSLTVVSPTGKAMTIPISTEQKLLKKVDRQYIEGVVWTTDPNVVDATGPVPLMLHLSSRKIDIGKLGLNL